MASDTPERLSSEADSDHQFQPAIILLSSTVLMITWKYFGSVDFYREQIAPRGLMLDDLNYTAAAYAFLMSFLLLGLLPALIVKFVLHQRVSDYGLRFGHLKKGAIAFLGFAPIFVLGSYIGSHDSAIREFYPINPSAAKAFGLHAILFFCHYIGWEFHFRGFLQHGLQNSMGQSNAILVQVMASTLLHIGMPVLETYMAILAGVLWGILAVRTQSIWPGLLLHFLLGISADYFLLFGG